MIMNGISLILDALDVVRDVAGARKPYVTVAD
jgi:hypothetical protein